MPRLSLRRALLIQADSLGGEQLPDRDHLSERRYFEQDPSRVWNVDVVGKSPIIPVLARLAVIEVVLVLSAALEDGGVDLNAVCGKGFCRCAGWL